MNRFETPVEEEARLKRRGWLLWPEPRLTITVGRPGIQNCSKCADRGWFYMRSPSRRSFRKKCSCKRLTRDEVQGVSSLGQDFKAALAWFQQSVPPEKPFRLFRWKFIEKPEVLWTWIESEIDSGSIYGLEAVRETVIRLHELFCLEEEF